MRVIAIAVIFIVGVTVAYQILKPDEIKAPKVYNPVDVEPELVDDDIERVGFGHRIQQFSLTDQLGNSFGSKQLKGKVYVAEYFFTTCGTICPIMNSQMQRVQDAFSSNKKVHIVSITVDPEHDSVAQMKQYADAHQANHKQWHFLTGNKENIYQLARRSFFLLKPSEVRNQGDVGSDFIHTNYFVLVDDRNQIRGYYDGTDEHEVSKLIQDIEVILEEEK